MINSNYNREDYLRGEYLKTKNSEATFSEFSNQIKKGMLDYVMQHEDEFEEGAMKVLFNINELPDEKIVAMYLEAHHFDNEIMDELAHSQDDKMPF